MAMPPVPLIIVAVVPPHMPPIHAMTSDQRKNLVDQTAQQYILIHGAVGYSTMSRNGNRGIGRWTCEIGRQGAGIVAVVHEP